MAVIRALERADLEPATAVFDQMLGSGRGQADPGLVAFFSRTLFEDPWADPELPSLVAEGDDGRIAGFMTVGARRMVLGERPVRIAVCANLCVTPEGQRRALGVRLMQRALQGPQDAALSDSASELARRMWVRLGGDPVPVSGLEWVRVFAPWRMGVQRLDGRVARPRARQALGRAAGGLDRLTAAAAPGRLDAPAPASGGVEALTAAGLVEAGAAVTGRLGLRPAYDAVHAEWLLAELGRVPERGALVARLVLRASEPRQVAGWFVYHLRPGKMSEVLSVAAADDAGAGLVLDHLFAHARSHGAASLRGRLEPRLVEAVTGRNCLLRRGGPALLHTRDDELARAVLSGDALLTRLEGEWAGGPLV